MREDREDRSGQEERELLEFPREPIRLEAESGTGESMVSLESHTTPDLIHSFVTTGSQAKSRHTSSCRPDLSLSGRRREARGSGAEGTAGSPRGQLAGGRGVGETRAS